MHSGLGRDGNGEPRLIPAGGSRTKKVVMPLMRTEGTWDLVTMRVSA